MHVGYQNRVKRVCGVHFLRNFWKILKDEDFGLKFGTPSTKFCFALIKKIYLRPLVEIVLGPPYEQNEFFYI